MTTESDRKQLIETLRLWLEDNLGAYKVASAILQDPKQVRGFVKSIAAKMSGALRYDPYNHPPEAAVFELARLSERLGGVLSDIDFLDEYEEQQERYQSAIRAIVGVKPQGESDPMSDVPETLS